MNNLNAKNAKENRKGAQSLQPFAFIAKNLCVLCVKIIRSEAVRWFLTQPLTDGAN